MSPVLNTLPVAPLSNWQMNENDIPVVKLDLGKLLFPRQGPFTAPLIPLNTWIHIVATWDGRQIPYYYNGFQVASYGASLNRGLVTTSNNYIGKSNWPDAYYFGSFDDLRIYNRVLAAGEVAYLYAQESSAALSPPLLGGSFNGSNFHLNLNTGQPNENFVLQSVTNLAAPILQQPVITNAADVNGIWQFTDSNLNGAQKFYRVRTP